MFYCFNFILIFSILYLIDCYPNLKSVFIFSQYFLYLFPFFLLSFPFLLNPFSPLFFLFFPCLTRFPFFYLPFLLYNHRHLSIRRILPNITSYPITTFQSSPFLSFPLFHGSLSFPFPILVKSSTAKYPSRAQT